MGWGGGGSYEGQYTYHFFSPPKILVGQMVVCPKGSTPLHSFAAGLSVRYILTFSSSPFRLIAVYGSIGMRCLALELRLVICPSDPDLPRHTRRSEHGTICTCQTVEKRDLAEVRVLKISTGSFGGRAGGRG